MKRKPDPHTEDLFYQPLAEYVSAEAPLFFAPEGEGCGPHHVPAGVVGGRAVCVLRGLSDAFEGPVSHLARLADRLRGEIEREYAEERRAWLGIAVRTARAAREDRLAERHADDRPSEFGEEREAVGGLEDERFQAFWNGVNYTAWLVREGGQTADEARDTLRPTMYGRRALALTYRRNDELFDETPRGGQTP